jgi:hypothetical protein
LIKAPYPLWQTSPYSKASIAIANNRGDKGLIVLIRETYYKGSTINKNGEPHLRNTMTYPSFPFLPKATSLEQLQQNLSISMTVSLL